MAGKKKSGSSKAWKLGGERIYPTRLNAADEKIFSSIFASHQKLRDNDPGSPFCCSVSIMNTRERAARAVAGYFCEVFGKCYRTSEIVGALATATSLPVTTAEWSSDMPSFQMGAVFWILDYIDQHGLWGAFYPLLPDEVDEELYFVPPPVDDFSHEQVDILRLLSVINGRKGVHRVSFQKILQLIDVSAISNLKSKFKTSLLDYFLRYLTIRTRVNAAPNTSQKYRQVPTINTISDIAESCICGFFAQMDEHADIVFLLKTLELIGASVETCQESFGIRRVAEQMAGFRVEDPYEISAAFFLLEQDGDLLASLNTLTASVIICAERQMPWAYGESYGWMKPWEAGTPSYAFQFPYNESFPKEEVKDTKPLEEGILSIDIEDGQRLSEAQLFYLVTGYALPRNRTPSKRITQWLVSQGLSQERAQEFAFGAMLSHYITELRDQVFPDWHPPVDIPKEEKPQPEIAEEEQSIEELRADLQNLNHTVKELRCALHDADRSIRQYQEKAQDAELQALQDRRELSQLRETLFRMKAEQGHEEVQDDAISLPFSVERRILVFGGHESWRKAIQPLLPGAKFFATITDVRVLKTADVIWIQANALSHKFYYRIMDIARRDDIPVRYFGFAGARKCAEELVAGELAVKENKA